MKIKKFNESSTTSKEVINKINNDSLFVKFNNITNEYISLKKILLEYLYINDKLDDNRDYSINNYYFGNDITSSPDYTDVWIGIKDFDDDKYESICELI